ncbi:MAG: menaquinone biosynthetic enzyme MqnA/MqnD family protein [Syntrophobacteraceae bacterium]
MGEPCMNLRLGRIGFLNVLPVYFPLESGTISHPFTIIPGVPSHLNELAAKGMLDMSPVSSIEYARHAGLYHIVPDLSISSYGEVKSVLLLSRLPIDRLTGTRVPVSSQSHTSVGLLKILCRLRFGVDPIFETGSFAEYKSGESPQAFLAIGDEALRLRRSGLYPYVLDLGAAWFDWTGLPFVYALWVISKKTIEERNGQVATAVEALLASKRWGLSHRSVICREAARAGLLGIEELEEYYHCLRYDLNEREKRGLELFFSYLLEIGELEQTPRLDVFTPLASVA